MRRSGQLGCVLGVILLCGVTALAVGELLGQTIEAALEDGSVVRGTVVEETDATLVVERGGERRAIQRAAIVSIRLLETSSQPMQPAPPQVSQPSASVDLRGAALWQLKVDAVQAARAILQSQIAASLPTYRWDLLITSLGVGVGGWVLDWVLKPSQEAIGRWRDGLPFWYGALDFGDGLVGLGGGVSMAVGMVQTEVDIGAGNPRVWFARASLLSLASAGINAVQMIYDGVMLAGPTD